MDHTELKVLYERRKLALDKLKKRWQKCCPHEDLKKTGGGMWHDWPNYGYLAINYTCIECGFLVQSDTVGSSKLDRQVVKDESCKVKCYDHY